MQIKKKVKKNQWTELKIKEGFERFFKENNKYPTATEIDLFPYLPSSRQIQRAFGGLVTLRKKLNLSGPTDFTVGDYSSARARTIGARAHRLERSVYDYLVDCFGKVAVHREYFFSDDHRTRTDFYIYSKKGNFSVDVFYPKDRHNLIGCVNTKLKSYLSIKFEYPVLFLMMNDTINEEVIADILRRKKNKLQTNQRILTWNQFETFCKVHK